MKGDQPSLQDRTPNTQEQFIQQPGAICLLWPPPVEEEMNYEYRDLQGEHYVGGNPVMINALITFLLVYTDVIIHSLLT